LENTMNSQWRAKTRFLPIITVSDADAAVPLAHALLEGGVDAIEFTLRTPQAIPAIEAVAKSVPELFLGAGTILSVDDFERAHNAGARFFVSPGFDPAIAHWPLAKQLLWLPGTQTASEVMVARRMGFSMLKFFPAEPAGGIELLKALAPVYPDVTFCPTGGIARERVADYLALPNVGAVGGSWVAPSAMLKMKDWKGITALAKSVSALF
jgi:2-dehydro-3-deoxyphosphogluconate aldolase / (4S)-4-hydroxy-2-oxoglutarate aldolase